MLGSADRTTFVSSAALVRRGARETASSRAMQMLCHRGRDSICFCFAVRDNSTDFHMKRRTYKLADSHCFTERMVEVEILKPPTLPTNRPHRYKYHILSCSICISRTLTHEHFVPFSPVLTFGYFDFRTHYAQSRVQSSRCRRCATRSAREPSQEGDEPLV